MFAQKIFNNHQHYHLREWFIVLNQFDVQIFFNGFTDPGLSI
jgi:hypothetical protein